MDWYVAKEGFGPIYLIRGVSEHTESDACFENCQLDARPR